MPLEKKGKKILVVCPHPVDTAPGQRLKYEQYFDSWRKEGYELTISPFMTMPFWNIVYKKGNFIKKALWTIWGHVLRLRDLFRLPFYDGVYIFLWVTPFGPPLFEWLFTKLNKNFIYDIDDMVFLGHVSEANQFILKLKGKSKMIYLMKHAKHVITCTPKLDEFVQKHNKNTTDISSTINTDTYYQRKDYSIGKKLVLGWSGSHSTSKYLHLLDSVVQEINKEHPLELKVIGTNDFRLEGVRTNALKWKREDEVKELSEFTIGLYPLPDEPWVYGKSGLKALQYMAMGIPTIAANIGANKRIIVHGENGFLVDSEEEWKECLLMLIQDEKLREKIGSNGRKTVEERFSIKANQGTYLNILRENF